MISVVVPVYNVDKYLDECVLSILNQVYKDFELILVDDGSTDNSGHICDDYLEKDDRIRVIHKENGGLSDARNKGTEVSEGEYITYIDSDDYIGNMYLQILYRIIIKYKADIAIVGIERYLDGNKPKANRTTSDDMCLTGFQALEKVLYQKGMDTSACAMLISKELALKHPFPLKKFHEDDFTTYKYYLDAQKVAVSRDVQYYYRQRKQSITYAFGQASIDELEAADNLVNEMRKVNNVLIEAARSKQYSDYCQVLLSMKYPEGKNTPEYKRVVKCLRSEKWNMIFNRRARNKNRLAAILMLLGPRFLFLANKLKKIRD